MWHEIPNIFVQKVSAVNPQIIQLDLYTMTLCQHMCLVLAVTRFLGWVILTLQLPYISRNTCETATSEARSTAKEQVLVSLKLATCDAIEHHRNFFQVPIAIFKQKGFPQAIYGVPNLAAITIAVHRHLLGVPNPLESIRMDQLTATVVETSSHFRKPPEAKAGCGKPLDPGFFAKKNMGGKRGHV